MDKKAAKSLLGILLLWSVGVEGRIYFLFLDCETLMLRCDH